MSNGKLISPNLDDRRWQDLADEAKRLISKHTPEWTDHNPTDLGITLIELFAWIAEQIIYRLNRVPDKNYIKFLDLIGVTRYPPTPTQAAITFETATDSVLTIPKGTQVSTPPTGTEEGIIFETNEELNAVNIKKCIYLDKSTNQYVDLTPKILEQPYETADLTIPGGDANTLLIGLAVPTILALTVTFKIHTGSSPVFPLWCYSSTGGPGDWPEVIPVINPNYSFEKSDRVCIQIPTDWQPKNPSDPDWGATPASPADEVSELLYWIGIHLGNMGGSAIHVLINRVAGNITSAINVLTVNEELLGESSGEPFQVFQLRNVPLYQDPQAANPLEHLVIAVQEGAGPWTNWQRVEEFNQEDAAHYMCHPTTGEISFGNYPAGDPDKPGYGRIPAEGSQIKAITYRYVAGGSNGNVPANTIVVQRIPVPGVISIRNDEAARDGSDWEKMEDTKRRGPQTLKIRDRAVTVEDYEHLAHQSTTDVNKARCFPPKKETPETWVNDPFERTPGRINVIIVPNDTESRQPMPSSDLITEVKDYLDERRTITSILIDPWPPFYVEVVVSITVYIKPGQNVSIIRQNIQQNLFAFLHPVTGGLGSPNGMGWEIGQDLYVPDVFAIIDSISEVSYVADLKIGRAGSAPVVGVRLEIKDYELICPSVLNDTNYAVTIEEEEIVL